MRSGGGAVPFSIADLFASSEQGAWYGPSDLSTLFQVSDGTTPVTTAGQPVGLMLDKSGRGNHATQATAAARLTYQTSPARATLDKVDDRLLVTVPTGGFTGTMVLATDQGTASYGVTIPAGAYDIGGRGGQHFPGNAIVGQLIRNGALSAGDAAATEAHFVANGATASYGAVTNFSIFWRNWSELTSFPLIDTSAGTDFGSAWQGCSSLTSFPLIDTSSGTDFRGTWFGCSSLTSFPLIDTSSGTNFRDAWFGCSSLTSFPLIDTSSGTNFQSAWLFCSSLTTIPAGLFDNVSGGNFNSAFNDTALTQTSIDNILVSLVASGIAAGTRVFDQSGGSAPSATGEAAIDTLRSRGWTVTVTGGYSPASLSALFAGSIAGAWYDPSDIDTLFQDSAGTTPVTTAGQPVGLMLDKSGNGNHATQAASSKRPTYTEGGGLSWLAFDGVDDAMEIQNAAFSFTGDQSVWVAAKHDTGTGGYIYLMGGNDKGYLFVTEKSTNRMRFIPITNGTGAVSTSVIGTSPIVFGGAWDRSSGDISLRENGVEYTASKTPADVTVPVVTLLGGGNPNGASWDGNIYGAVIVNNLTTASETGEVEAYLAAKSGVTL